MSLNLLSFIINLACVVWLLNVQKDSWGYLWLFLNSLFACLNLYVLIGR